MKFFVEGKISNWLPDKTAGFRGPSMVYITSTAHTLQSPFPVFNGCKDRVLVLFCSGLTGVYYGKPAVFGSNTRTRPGHNPN
jgi:hypothetical protein